MKYVVLLKVESSYEDESIQKIRMLTADSKYPLEDWMKDLLDEMKKEFAKNYRHEPDQVICSGSWVLAEELENGHVFDVDDQQQSFYF